MKSHNARQQGRADQALHGQVLLHRTQPIGDEDVTDERRHVGFGENYIGALIQREPEKRPEIEKMQQEMSYYMLATFADQFSGDENRAELDEMRKRAREAGDAEQGTWQGVKLGELDPEEMEGLLAGTVLKEFKTRLGRIGIEYQTPAQP